MIRPIMHDESFLAQVSADALRTDVSVARDLVDTLKENKKNCVGMAANMIGVLKRVIAFEDNGKYIVMLNPVITDKTGEYTAQEGCLSLTGVRTATRYQKIEVTYQDTMFRTKKASYEGWTAQIIQHEIDHCNGILI